LSSVEFALVGLVVFTVLLSAIEMGRMMFTLNMLREATFRGARVAAVCPIGDTKIALAAIFDGAGAGTSLLPALTTANIQVNYLDAAGNIIVNPGTAGNFIDIRFVNVQIVNFSHNFLVPALDISFTTDSYPATLPTESLGISREGAGAVAC
jgi:Flp pilus assembly protein TadG